MKAPVGHALEALLPVPFAQRSKAAAIPKTSMTFNLLCSPDPQNTGLLSAFSPHAGVLLHTAITGPKASAQS